MLTPAIVCKGCGATFPDWDSLWAHMEALESAPNEGGRTCGVTTQHLPRFPGPLPPGVERELLAAAERLKWKQSSPLYSYTKHWYCVYAWLVGDPERQEAWRKLYRAILDYGRWGVFAWWPNLYLHLGEYKYWGYFSTPGPKTLINRVHITHTVCWKTRTVVNELTGRPTKLKPEEFLALSPEQRAEVMALPKAQRQRLYHLVKHRLLGEWLAWDDEALAAQVAAEITGWGGDPADLPGR